LLRQCIIVTLLVLTAAAIALAILNVNSPIRLFVTGVFLVLAPGWAVSSYLPIATPSLEWIVAAATGIALSIIVAQIMVSTHWWHPVGALIVLGALTFGMLLHHLVRLPAGRHVPR
jgi:uncharacterized membrane protein